MDENGMSSYEEVSSWTESCCANSQGGMDIIAAR